MNLEGILALWIVLGVVVAAAVLFAYLFSIKLFIDAIRAKGYAAKRHRSALGYRHNHDAGYRRAVCGGAA